MMFLLSVRDAFVPGHSRRLFLPFFSSSHFVVVVDVKPGIEQLDGMVNSASIL